MSVRMDDKAELGIGIGYILGQLKFNVYTSMTSTARIGYRVRRTVEWRNKEPFLHILSCIQQVLDIGGLTYQSIWMDKDSQLRIYHLIQTLDKEYPIVNAFADAVGYHMWKWTYDNPVPTAYEDFIAWAESYDLEHESVSIENLN